MNCHWNDFCSKLCWKGNVISKSLPGLQKSLLTTTPSPQESSQDNRPKGNGHFAKNLGKFRCLQHPKAPKTRKRTWQTCVPLRPMDIWVWHLEKFKMLESTWCGGRIWSWLLALPSLWLQQPPSLFESKIQVIECIWEYFTNRKCLLQILVSISEFLYLLSLSLYMCFFPWYIYYYWFPVGLCIS